jgi:hypothetical protein
LPFYLIINATPDNFYINSLKEKRKDFIIDSYNFRGVKKDFVEMGTAEKPLIYYLYGNLHKPESMVISQNDLLDFLVAIISKSPALPNNIRSEFADRKLTEIRPLFFSVLVSKIGIYEFYCMSYKVETENAVPLLSNNLQK